MQHFVHSHLRLFVASLVVGALLTTSDAAAAHERELGISIEPSMVVLPAVATEGAQNTLAFSPAGGFSVEYSFLNNFAVITRASYAFAVTDSLIGQASFQNRTGNYYFRQQAVVTSAGLRVDTPAHWMPIELSASLQGGAAILIQTDRELRDDQGIKYKLAQPLGTLLRTAPLLVVTAGISTRVWHQIRVGVEPTLFVGFFGRTYVGFGVNAALTFMFFV